MSEQSSNPFTHETTIEDLMENPGKYGAPSFEEFKRNREKFFPDKGQDNMIFLTDGPRKFRRDLRKIIFKINGREVKPEQVEIALGDFGYNLAHIDLMNRNCPLKREMQMVPLGGGKFDVVINFKP